MTNGNIGGFPGWVPGWVLGWVQALVVYLTHARRASRRCFARRGRGESAQRQASARGSSAMRHLRQVRVTVEEGDAHTHTHTHTAGTCNRRGGTVSDHRDTPSKDDTPTLTIRMPRLTLVVLSRLPISRIPLSGAAVATRTPAERRGCCNAHSRRAARLLQRTCN